MRSFSWRRHFLPLHRRMNNRSFYGHNYFCCKTKRADVIPFATATA